MVKSSDLFSKVEPDNLFIRITQFPILRIFIITAILLPVTIASEAFHQFVISDSNFKYIQYIAYAAGIFFIVLNIWVYSLYTKGYERRKALEFSLNGFIGEFAGGAAIAFVVVTFVVALMYFMGYYQIEGINSYQNAIFMFFEQLDVAFIEELLFRLILFKLVEEFAGSWIAIAVQGILFGFAHFFNPNATLFTSLALVLAYSVLFGAGFMMTRRIWFVMGLHWSWNFFQAGIFGMPNSGNIQPSLIAADINGPVWITGGAWGIEASYISIFILFVIGIIIYRKAKNRGQVVQPKWKRDNDDKNNFQKETSPQAESDTTNYDDKIISPDQF
ncbi:MAG: CPBP family intramembrane metalloprotease [Melioribacteraceae bacterium]|nr:CPBP family intramembrane metalloprotease [Melioribacteraceae bacterium]MCF8355307.1 CPBP family intramembrane metalloprotease [Melioribacteraceae bacterium]MCF8396433.1 CPBP family intramembrane metalloprotease [Melioribacteraceae bacterium]MCF8420385.1 CPBP family intramembrane metalloprotease [Melioribacteraceae bacterium]